jgi:hypothetical protein
MSASDSPKPTTQNPKQPTPTRLKITNTEDYRDAYANSVQIRLSIWDFHVAFGTMHPEGPEDVTVKNFQGIYLSPQQAKALWTLLGQNLAQYEQTFGAIALEPHYIPPTGPIH